MIIYFRLCKLGYARSIEEAKMLDARTVLQAQAYENFLMEYQDEFRRLNTNESG